MKENKGLLKVQEQKSAKEGQNPHLDIIISQNNEITETNNQI